MSAAAKIESAARRLLLTRSRAAKALFLDGKTGELTLEARALLADLEEFARLDGRHAFMRDTTGAIDPLGMARVEGRREVVMRLLGFLKLDPNAIQTTVEVDNGR